VIEIVDNYISKDLYGQLCTTSHFYGRVAWVGINAEPECPLHDLTLNVFDSHVKQVGITGATVWWNVRAKDCRAHSDIESYSTKNNVSYRPDILPEKTFIYYLKAPEKGGHLSIYTRARFFGAGKDIVWEEHETDTISAIENRLIAFPADVVHQVLPYEGNRVSIGMIFWVDLPKIYPTANPNMNMYFDRVWEIEDAKQISMYV